MVDRGPPAVFFSFFSFRKRASLLLLLSSGFVELERHALEPWNTASARLPRCQEDAAMPGKPWRQALTRLYRFLSKKTLIFFSKECCVIKIIIISSLLLGATANDAG